MLVRQSRWLTWAGLVGFLIMAGAPVHAGNLEFLSKSPVSYFNDEDMRLLKETVAQVLDDKDALAKKSWSNPATGNSGEVEALGCLHDRCGCQLQTSSREQPHQGS